MHEQKDSLSPTRARPRIRKESPRDKTAELAADSVVMVGSGSATGRDVLDRQESESESRYRRIVEATNEGVWLLDSRLFNSYVNQQMAEMLGYQPEEMVGRSVFDFYFPDDVDQKKQVLKRRREGLREQIEERVRRKDGSELWVRMAVIPVVKDNGEFDGALAMVSDITERRQAERAQRQSEERFRLAAQAGKMFAYEWDAATDVIVRSAESARILGIDETVSITGQQIMAKIHSDDRERVKATIANLTPEKPNLQVSYRMVLPDSSLIWVERSSRAHFDQQDRIVRIVGMVADVTERKRAEESLRLFRALIDESNDAIEVVDPETMRFLDVNEKACRELGYSRDELLSLSVPDIDPTVDELLHTRAQKEVGGSSGVLFERVHRRKDGSTFPVEINLKRVELDRPYCVNVVRDITERKRAEEALHQRGTDLAEAQRLSRIGSWQWDPENDTVTWSEELYRIAGRDPSLPAPTYREHTELYTLASWERLQHVVDEALRTGTPYELDLEMILPGGIEKWVTGRGEPQRDTSGRIARLRGTVQDITDRKLAEESLASLSKRLMEAQEQERSRIARDLHDDIGQRLALLAVELEQLQQASSDLPSEITNRINKMREETCKISADVQSLSHELHSPRLEHLGVAAAMKGFCREFGEHRKAEIDFKFHDLPGPVPQDVSLCLFRVLQEALHNSSKHSGVRRFEVQLWGTPGEIHLTVCDSGLGFDSEVAKKSRGLGLISMQERVKLVKGTFSIESQLHHGTKIHARVPVSSGSDSVRVAG